MTRRLPVLLVVVALVTVALPVRSTCPCSLTTDRDGLDGDTYVFELDPDDGPGFKILKGSKMVIEGTYPFPGREDGAGAFAVTDLQTTAQEVVAYSTFVDPMETHVEVLTDTPVGTQVDLFEPSSSAAGLRLTVTFLSDVWFPDRAWYFALSVPEASTVDVHLDLAFNKPMSIQAEGTGASGLVAAAEDFDGTAQMSSTPATIGTGMEVSATAPAGNRSFAVLVPFGDVAAGRWGVDGPGGFDDRVTGLGIGTGPPAAVLAGPAGTYRHWVDADASAGDVTGRVAVFFGAPMPL